MVRRDYEPVYSREDGEVMGYLSLQRIDGVSRLSMEYGCLMSTCFEEHLIRETSKKLPVSSRRTPTFTRNRGEVLKRKRCGFYRFNDRRVQSLGILRPIPKRKSSATSVKFISPDLDGVYLINGTLESGENGLFFNRACDEA